MRKVNDTLARYRSGERADEQEAQLALHGCALRLSNKLEEYAKSWKAETIDEKNLLDIAYKSELEALVRNGLGDLARLLDQCIVLRGDVTDKYILHIHMKTLVLALGGTRVQSSTHVAPRS